MDIRDMSDLIYVRDAYKAMNKTLHGEEMVLGFHEGYLGALGRVFRVIERNISGKWKNDDDSAMRILDAISLSPEERARLLLEEGKCRSGEEVLKKYEFNKKLKEGVLTGKIKGQASVIIDGIESKARCNAMGKVGMRGIPCLVSENNSRGSMRFTVEAVSHGSKDGKKEWVCINPMLIEQAVGFFLENHQMQRMVGHCNYVNKVSVATAGKGRPGFQVGNAWVEVRNLGRRSSGLAQESLVLSIKQVEKYCQKLSAMQEATERMILLLICQDGTQDKMLSFIEKASDEIKNAVGTGVEIWIAEMQIDADGISLLTYQNVTDKISGN